MLLGTQHEHIGLNTNALQLLHTVLRGLGLKLASGVEVRHVGEVNVDGVASQFPLQLANGLHVRSALNVANGSTDLGNHEIVVLLLAEVLHVTLDLVGDMGHHLDGLAQIIATALLVDHGLIDTTRGQRVGLGGLNACETLVVSEVEVGLHAINSYITLTVLVGVERARVDIDVRIKFLNGDVVASGLQKLANRRGDDAFT